MKWLASAGFSRAYVRNTASCSSAEILSREQVELFVREQLYGGRAEESLP
jgi:hypothetical protein